MIEIIPAGAPVRRGPVRGALRGLHRAGLLRGRELAEHVVRPGNSPGSNEVTIPPSAYAGGLLE